MAVLVLQRFAVTGCWKGSSRDRLYDELGWESLSDRRNNNLIFHIYKVISKTTLSYLKAKLPPCRNHFLIHVFRDIRISRYPYSFFKVQFPPEIPLFLNLLHIVISKSI